MCATVDAAALLGQGRVVRGAVGSTAEEVALVEAARGGDRRAFADLYRRYAPLVHGMLLARVAPDEADDLVQDVFLRAMRKLGGLRDPRSFGGWIAAIARTRSADYHRRRPRTGPLPEDLPGPRPRTADALAALAAIRELPLAYRETLILRLVEGLTGPEIAQRTGLSPGSVRVNLHRGMKRLRGSLRGGSEKGP